jgi:hypothetical protein
MRSPCALCACVSVSPNNFFACVVVVGTCSPSLCLAMTIFSGSTIPVSRHHVTLHSEVVGCSVFCAVRVA